MICPLHIAIVGCGTAGLSTALFLEKLGHQITLFDQTEKLNPIGAGLLLQPTGMHVLKQLNLIDFILKNGTPVYRLYGVLSSKKVVMDLNYHDLAPGLFGLGVHRGILFQALYEKCKSQNIVIQLGIKQENFEKLNKKYFLTDSHFNKHGPYDFVIASDGARSSLRRQFNGLKKEKPYPWGAMWAILENTTPHYQNTLFQVYEGTENLLGFLPTGVDPSDGKKKVSLFWSIKNKDHEKNFDFEKWKNKISNMSPEMSCLLSQITSPQQMIVATYMDVVMNRWHDGEGLVFLGDSAHATSPQLGQGANLALLDAEGLNQAFIKTSTLPEALNFWTQYRKKHIQYYQWASRFMTPFFQSQSKTLGFLRDHLMNIFCQTEPFRHLVLSTMSGFKTGLFSENDFRNSFFDTKKELV